jgi:hypothetical protein
MTTLNKLVQNVSHQFSEHSVSWGSLLLWVGGLAVVIMLMARFSQIY